MKTISHKLVWFAEPGFSVCSVKFFTHIFYCVSRRNLGREYVWSAGIELGAKL